MRFLARQLKRVLLGALLAAGAFVLSAPVTFALMLARYRASRNRGVPEGPPVEPPAPGERNLDDVMGELEKIPFNPVSPPVVGVLKGALNNSFLALLNARRATAGLAYPYPNEFDLVTFESFDGAPLCAVVGLHGEEKPRPGLVISHGYMGSKNDHYIISLALTAFAEWGFNVLAIDLRDFGRSMSLGFNPTTFGWREGEDLLAGARYLGESPGVTTVGITGFSLGAVSTMRAAYMAREYPYLTGGAIAWNGASDARRLLPHLDQRPEVSEEFFPFYYMFRLMHGLRREDMKHYVEDPETKRFLEEPSGNYNFTSYLERISARRYGVTIDDIFDNCSSRNFLKDVEVPLLIIHSEDDPICPPSEMDDLIEIAKEKPNIDVWVLPTGMHCVFPYLDRNWFEAVTRRFFEYWAEWGE